MKKKRRVRFDESGAGAERKESNKKQRVKSSEGGFSRCTLPPVVSSPVNKILYIKLS